ncbi:hypothetical protein HPB50_004185 [Hyalomma asiaticum]|uniref:Uncharacterized protein n=1 Tax=Hyalomma asiaticum TaxID=266040 RepID=A0ACB7RYZ7_HYAAI|nr:hypothetical protein HPB50_004185 [Hyalomma asiaticum]
MRKRGRVSAPAPAVPGSVNVREYVVEAGSGSSTVDKASRNGAGDLIEVREVWVDEAHKDANSCQGDHSVFRVWCMPKDAKRLMKNAAFAEVSDS